MGNYHSYLTTKEAAAVLRYKPSTMAQWRAQAKGPRYLKFGGIRYRREDLDEWANASPAERIDLEASYPYHQDQKTKTKRLRGRKGKEQRERRLAYEPNCRICLQVGGFYRKSTEVDHIVPLSLGGTDEDDNIRCLCASCHQDRTNAQRRAWG